MSASGKGHITIWQCLSHLTGIASGSLKESLQGFKDIKSMEEAVEKIAALPMEGTPGKTFHYSNTGLQLAAAVIEKISGRSFETLFAERIAQPCNMINSDFGKGRVALAAGGAWSTATDYLNFLQMILHEGIFNGKTVLSKNAIIEMQKNRITADTKIMASPAEAGNWGYGFGEWITDDATGEKRSDAVTSPGLFGSFPWVNNQKQYAGFLMTFNLKNKGRHEKYKELKTLVDEALATR
jgi:CubicO group peptidase (beta-lactamase class C family)